MKKNNVLQSYQLFSIFALLFVVAACNKNNDEDALPNPAEQTPHRGRLIEQQMKVMYSAQTLNSTLLASGDQVLIDNFSANNDVVLYKITYETIDLDGNFTPATGLLVVPTEINGAPVLSFQHGATLHRQMVPSQMQGTWYLLGALMAAQGYITLMPDFLGLGDNPGLHPFLHAETEASATIDFIRATYEFLQQKNIDYSDQLFLAGYSQGGHATLATQKVIERDFSDEFTITACAPMAGPYDVSGVQAENLVTKIPYEFQAYFPYILFAMNNVYDIFDDITSILQAPYNTTLPPFFDGTSLTALSEINDYMPSSGIPSDILTEQAYNSLSETSHPLYNALADNDLIYDWTPQAPLKLYHCDADQTVFYANSEKAYTAFAAAGADVELLNPLAGGNHETCAIPSIAAAFVWFNTLRK